MSDYVDALYRELLGRPVGPADMQAGKWAGHPESTVRTGIMHSAEYQARQAQPGVGSMSGFMHGFGALPSSSSSALDFEQFKQSQLPYEQDYWKFARENLPAFSDQAVRSGEAGTLSAEQAAAMIGETGLGQVGGTLQPVLGGLNWI